MKKKDIKVNALVSITLAILGFVLDLGERVDNVWVNVGETLMLAVLIFVFVLILKFAVDFFQRLFKIDKAS